MSRQAAGDTANTPTNGVVRNVLVCAEDTAAGPREGLLVFGKDFMSDKIREGGAFYLKAQRVGKFCAPRALGGAGPLVVVCDKVRGGARRSRGGCMRCSPDANFCTAWLQARTVLGARGRGQEHRGLVLLAGWLAAARLAYGIRPQPLRVRVLLLAL